MPAQKQSENLKETLMIKINTPPIPARKDLPTDAYSSWANGFRACAGVFEKALSKAMPDMSDRSREVLVREIERHMGLAEVKFTAKKIPPAKVKMTCGHAARYIEFLTSDGRMICTLCGTTKRANETN